MCTASGEPIVLRGSNYIRLDGLAPPLGNGSHSTFSPAGYNRSRHRAALDRMSGQGFNVVRVFVDHRADTGVGGAASAQTAVSTAYVAKLAEFISDASRLGLYTIVTLEGLPQTAFYAARTPPAANMSALNAPYLAASWARAWETFWAALARTLRHACRPSAQAAAIFSLQNELMLQGDEPPFDAHAGSVATAAGTFSLGEAASRQQAADANLVLWADRGRSTLQAAWPAALVTVGMFTFAAVGKAGPDGLMRCSASGDCRFPVRPAVLANGSSLDFLDVHIYQKDGSAAALRANLRSEEWAAVLGAAASKPIVMGEFGCLGGLSGGGWYANASLCVPPMRMLQRSSCAERFVGWLFWTWDTDTPSEQPEWWSMEDEGGAIGAALAPVENPDPCR